MRQYKVELTKMLLMKQVVTVNAKDDIMAIREAHFSCCSGNWVTETECPAMGRILSSSAFSDQEKTYDVRVYRKTEEHSDVVIKTTCTEEDIVKGWAIDKAFEEADWEACGTEDVRAEISEVK